MSPLGTPDSPPPPPSPLPGGSRSLPERMKANKAVAGTVCAGCHQPVALGQEVYNCPACGTSQHDACHTKAGTCCSPDCTAGEEAAGAPGAPMKACPYCGEQILKSARKCRHCKEILSPALRKAREAGAKGAPNLGREALMYGLLGLVCFGIILGPVAIFKGSKALKQNDHTTMAGFGIALGVLDILIFLIYIVSKF